MKKFFDQYYGFGAYGDLPGENGTKEYWDDMLYFSLTFNKYWKESNIRMQAKYTDDEKWFFIYFTKTYDELSEREKEILDTFVYDFGHSLYYTYAVACTEPLPSEHCGSCYANDFIENYATDEYRASLGYSD